ncbi:MAG: branched-chain amino acid transport system II carrier protein [Rickettsiales bacterium]
MNRNTLTVGFAVFTMFFGAGNMVLPLFLMQKWSNYWLPAFIGFCITAVFVTLLGLISSVLAQGDIKKFFAPLGLIGGLILQIILIAIEGPFGIVPRSLIVAFGGVETLWPNFSPHLFYFLSCVLVFFLAIDKNRIVKVIGTLVTPVMLLFLLFIIIYSFSNYGFSGIDLKLNNSEAFVDGLLEGYLTYDLPGAIYFTSIAMAYLTAINSNKKDILSNGIKSSFVSAILLIFVYSLFIYLGLSHKALLHEVSPEQILPTIIKGAFGPILSFIFVIFIFLACITTAIAAITIWSDFIHHYFPKLNYRGILAASLSIAFIVSSLGFTHLMKLLGPVLNFIYPILICLTIYNIIIGLKSGIEQQQQNQELPLDKTSYEK